MTRSDFERLPPELLIPILASLSGLECLDNLLRASPAAYRLFDTYGAEIFEPVMSAGENHQFTVSLIRIAAHLRTSSLPPPVHTLYSLRNYVVGETTAYNHRKIVSLTVGCLDYYLGLFHALKPQQPVDKEFRFDHQEGQGKYDHVGAWQLNPPLEPFPMLDAGSPTWVEEQRVMRACWRLALFKSAKVAFEAGRLPRPPENDGISDMYESQIQEMGTDLLTFYHVTTGGWWYCRYGREPRGHGHYLAENNKQNTTTPDFLARARRRSWPAPAPQGPEDSEVLGDVWGVLRFYWDMSGGTNHWENPVSPIQHVRLEPFRRAGFTIWGERRMRAGGFLDTATASSSKDSFHGFHACAAAWLSILTREILGEIARENARHHVSDSEETDSEASDPGEIVQPRHENIYYIYLWFHAIMELSHDLVRAVWNPNFIHHYPRLRAQASQAKPVDWNESGLNPRNRIDSLPPLSSLRWRIDGGRFGTQFFAVPLDITDVPPLRIDVFIPDRNDIPTALIDSLDASSLVPLQKNDVSMSGLAKHVCHALDAHCRRDPDFLKSYMTLPSGSKLIFENIASSVAHMKILTVPNYELERNAPSLGSLQAAWKDILSHNQWPPIIDIMEIRLASHLHDTVALVHCPTHITGTPDGTAVFKHSTSDLQILVHELRHLLSTTPHPNMMPRPLGIVTKKSNFSGKLAVLGFLLPYYGHGSLRDLLPQRRLAGTLQGIQQLTWCKQVTSALLHVQKSAGTFYSDLRPDNVLISDDSYGGGRDVAILCDFEQRGNWFEWCPPEIVYAQYVDNLRKSWQSVDEQSIWEDLIQKSHQEKYRAGARNRAWTSLSHETQEKAMVYCLGLFIYCVFEGQSNVCGNKANRFTYEPDIEFPKFRLTPLCIREIIKRCTESGVQHSPEKPRGESSKSLGESIVRIRGLVYPHGELHCERDTSSTACHVLDVVSRYWEQELAQAKDFLSCGNGLVNLQTRLDLGQLRGIFDDLEQWRIEATGARRKRCTQHWQVERGLGRGGFGEVRLERNQESGQLRAVKRINTAGQLTNLDLDCKREMKALAELSKPKLRNTAVFIEFYGWFATANDLFLAMEYAALGDLFMYTESNPGPMPETEARAITEQILCGVEIMHEETLGHYDLKTRNILIISASPNWWVKLCDFGLTRRETEATGSYTRGGTQEYMAPEQLFHLGTEDLLTDITCAVDIWSVGCIIYRLMTGTIPFPAGTSLVKFCEDSSLFPHNSLLESNPPSKSFDLVRRLLTPRPAARLSARQALNHDWFRTPDEANSLLKSPSYQKPDRTDISPSCMVYQPATIKERELSFIGQVKARISEKESMSTNGSMAATAAGQLIRLWDPRTGRDHGILKGHMDWVSSVIFSPSRNILASGSCDKTVRIWNPVTESEQMSFVGHTDGVTNVSFSNCGNLLVSTSRDQTVRVWDTLSGNLHTVFEGHEEAVLAAAFSHNDESIASASRDKSVRLWSLPEKSIIYKLEGHTDWVTAISFSCDGKTLASASLDKTVRLWDPASGTSIAVLRGYDNWIHPVIFDANGISIKPVSPSMTVRLQPPPAAGTGGEFTNWFSALGFSRDDELIICASRDKTIRLWDLKAKESYGTLKLHMNGLNALVFSADGLPATPAAVSKLLPLWRKALVACVEGGDGTLANRDDSQH
ncbi:hypothetical protein PG991_006336 [Apiospora marii]|uniref:Protein kinase domain-containing protein n=1 Tax=Apiospora marii TaxID=335849 RepID=A0ABR1SD09_9PEZI